MIFSSALRYAWPSGPTLDFPDLELASGGALLLRGPSGSGKSTWLALLAGLLTPSAGVLEVAGTHPAQLAQAERDAWRARHIGFLPQRGLLSQALSVHDNLQLVAYAGQQPLDRAHTQHLIEALGLGGLLQRRPHQLSTGQALRVALARALLRRPAVLLADEPTASLDDELAAQAMALISQHAQQHAATLVVATHDQRAVQALPHAHTLRLQPHAGAQA